MRKPTPIQTVKKSFGGRSELLDKLVPLVDDLHDEGEEALRSRLGALPNKKLIRLYQVEQKVRERFGGRDQLVEHLVSARIKAGLSADDKYKEKLAGYSKARLLDLTRERFGARPAKQTPEQRMAKKRGRKQRERAKSKLGQN